MKECFVSGVLNTAPVWVEENGIIRTSVISDGTTGKQWFELFESRNIIICNETKHTLLSSRFVPTTGVRTEIAIFRSALLPFGERYTISAHEMGLMKGLAIPEIEATFLLRVKFPNKVLKAMGLKWIAVMHTPVPSFENNPISLTVDCYKDDEEWIYSHGARDYDSWEEDGGFAYEIPS